MTIPQGPSPSTVTSLKSRLSLPPTTSRIKTALAPSPTPGSEITKPLLLAPLTHSLSKTSASRSLFWRPTPMLTGKTHPSPAIPLHSSKTLMTTPQGPSPSTVTSLKSRHSLPLTHSLIQTALAPSPIWIRDNETIATGSSYTLTQQDVGFSISLQAAYTDAYGKDTSVTSNSSALIQNVDDPASAQVLIHGNAEEGGSLTASLHNFSDPDGSLANTSFQWQQRIDDRWVPIDGQTSPI